MSVPNLLINKRENLLNRILNNDPGEFLNQDHCSPEPHHSDERLGEKIKDTLNQIKSLSISSDGNQVNYQDLARDPIYKTYRDLTCRLKHFDYDSLRNDDEKLAFWINLYNTLVLDGVIQSNVKQSIIESRLGILSFFQNNAYVVNGQRFSLTDIEHGVLRANRGFPYFPGEHGSS